MQCHSILGKQEKWRGRMDLDLEKLGHLTQLGPLYLQVYVWAYSPCLCFLIILFFFGKYVTYSLIVG